MALSSLLPSCGSCGVEFNYTSVTANPFTCFGILWDWDWSFHQYEIAFIKESKQQRPSLGARQLLDAVAGVCIQQGAWRGNTFFKNIKIKGRTLSALRVLYNALFGSVTGRICLYECMSAGGTCKATFLCGLCLSFFFFLSGPELSLYFKLALNMQSFCHTFQGTENLSLCHRQIMLKDLC